MQLLYLRKHVARFASSNTSKLDVFVGRVSAFGSNENIGHVRGLLSKEEFVRSFDSHG